MVDLFGNPLSPKKPKPTKRARSSWLDEMRATSESRKADLRIVSFGAGVQSTTLLLMAIKGLIKPKPDYAIFSDTGWEPAKVYEHLEWIIPICEEAGIGFHVVSAGNIREDVLSGLEDTGFASLPLYVRNEEGGRSILRRQCTREYKITPIEQKIRELLGYAKNKRVQKLVEQWLGISLDEMQRMRDNRTAWCVNRYPLIEKRITRSGCISWLRDHGYPIPHKSSCIGCPFHDDGYWRDLKRDSPDEFNEAVAFDRSIRNANKLRGVASVEAYLHRSMIPLEDVDLLTEKDLGQLGAFDDGMLDECSGYCGV